MRSSIPISCSSALILLACSTAEPGFDEPLPLPPGVAVSTHRYAGGALGGPETGSIELGEDLATVSFACYYLERAPEHDLPLLVAESSFVADRGRESPVRPTSLLGAKTHVGRGELAREVRESITTGGAGRFSLILEEELPLPRGATAAFEGRASDVITGPQASWNPDPLVEVFERGISLHVSRSTSSSAMDLLLVFTGPTAMTAYDPDAEEPVETALPRSVSLNERMSGWRAPLQRFAGHEIVRPGEPLTSDGEPVVLVIQSPFDQFQERVFAVFVEARFDGRVVTEADRTILRNELEASARIAGESGVAADVDATHNGILLEALGRAAADRESRRALVLLADRVGAPLGEDLALIADDSTLESYLARIAANAGEELDLSSAHIAWLLERTAYAALADRASREGLPHDLDAILLRHAGEIGRFPTTIEETLAACGSLADLEVQLVALNRFALEDSDPSARVRAWDWLVARELPPPGYQPLAPPDERRAALQRLDAAEDPAGAEDGR